MAPGFARGPRRTANRSRGTPLTAIATTVAPPADIVNLRDLGGHRTRSGEVVRRGLAFRSADLAGLAPGEARAALAHLGIRTVYDLRTTPERKVQPERPKLPGDTRYVIADVMRDSPAGSPAHLFRLIANPPAAEAAFGNGRGVAMFEERYREFVTLPSARAAFRRVFVGLGDTRRLPALFHCTTGKDRTGWAAAALLLLLEVPEDAVLGDYLASNAALRGTLGPALDRFEAAGGDRAWLEPLSAVRPTYLEAAFGEMRRGYGSIAGYFAVGLGIDAAGQRRLRARFIEGD